MSEQNQQAHLQNIRAAANQRHITSHLSKLAFMELKMATITARLATIQALIQQKNTNLAEVMTQVNRLKMQGNELERNMGTSKREYRHLIEVYKQGLKTVEGMLRQSMI
jgi:hypothetical protein